MRIALFDKSGEQVKIVEMPVNTVPGGAYPDVIQYGVRVFVLQTGRYVEATYWAVP